MSQALAQPFWKRFVIALSAAAVLVFACSLSMQLHALQDPEWVLAVAIGVLVASIPASVLSAFVFRRSPLALILGSQVLTVVALAAWFGLRA
jgi:anti-sigma-K factor RskA